MMGGEAIHRGETVSSNSYFDSHNYNTLLRIPYSINVLINTIFATGTTIKYIKSISYLVPALAFSKVTATRAIYTTLSSSQKSRQLTYS